MYVEHGKYCAPTICFVGYTVTVFPKKSKWCKNFCNQIGDFCYRRSCVVYKSLCEPLYTQWPYVLPNSGEFEWGWGSGVHVGAHRGRWTPCHCSRHLLAQYAVCSEYIYIIICTDSHTPPPHTHTYRHICTHTCPQTFYYLCTGTFVRTCLSYRLK